MENDSLVRELVEDNEGIATDLISDKLGSASESKVQANGSHGVGNSDRDELNLKGADVELKPDVSTPTPTRKGFGLKKWRRIKRDANRDGDSGTDAVAVVAQDSPRESSLGLSPSFAAGTDSENSEDRSSKSSTAASAPRMRYEIPYGQHGKGRIEASKKARGERGAFSLNNGRRSEGINEYDGQNGDEVQGIGKQVNDGSLSGYDNDSGRGEVLKFKEIGNDVSVDELEDLFKQKVEAELEYLVLSRTVQKMRVAAVDQITVLEEQKAPSSVQTQVLDQLGDAEHKAVSLKKQADKLENFCEEIASADEILKLQKGAFKLSPYTNSGYEDVVDC
ncbi:hypothetical protein SASPL_130461 [Salvia splendens]|uniref:WPP domain-interacting protein n=1 Tax=Salvia splendens TaxID=180675 RepID=A0A8X8X627_SALSN|nr:hypothetical protein SASPL_130461 [Salvia splendens]